MYLYLQGVQAQTVANFLLASEAGLSLVPVINKVCLCKVFFCIFGPYYTLGECVTSVPLCICVCLMVCLFVHHEIYTIACDYMNTSLGGMCVHVLYCTVLYICVLYCNITTALFLFL